MNEQHAFPVVSALLEGERDGVAQLFLQTRWKPTTSPTYSGLLEIPAGGLRAYESVYDAIAREVSEECGLAIVSFQENWRGPVATPSPNDESFAFRPFMCQQVLKTNKGLPWVGFVFLCRVTGTPKINPDETKDPRWISIRELKTMLTEQPKKFFPLQLPVLLAYVEWNDRGRPPIEKY